MTASALTEWRLSLTAIILPSAQNKATLGYDLLAIYCSGFHLP